MWTKDWYRDFGKKWPLKTQPPLCDVYPVFLWCTRTVLRSFMFRSVNCKIPMRIDYRNRTSHRIHGADWTGTAPPCPPVFAEDWGQSTVLSWYSRTQEPDFHLQRYGSHPTANRMAHLEHMGSLRANTIKTLMMTRAYFFASRSVVAASFPSRAGLLARCQLLTDCCPPSADKEASRLGLRKVNQRSDKKGLKLVQKVKYPTDTHRNHVTSIITGHILCLA